MKKQNIQEKFTPAGQIVYLALGSNIHPREQYILDALDLLKKHFPTQFLASGIYLTAPYAGLEQNSYYNCCAQFVTDQSPEILLQTVLNIEKILGRKRSGTKWESRVIDIDIVLYGSELIQTERLTVPHYDLHQRDFFLIPLLELNPKLVDPRTGLSLQVELEQVPLKRKTNPVKVSKTDQTEIIISGAENHEKSNHQNRSIFQ